MVVKESVTRFWNQLSSSAVNEIAEFILKAVVLETSEGLTLGKFSFNRGKRIIKQISLKKKSSSSNMKSYNLSHKL